MTEQSIEVGGRYVAARECQELDSDSHSRICELVDFAGRKLPSPIGTAVRGSSAAVSADDTLDVTGLPADLTSHLIAVGDRGILACWVEHAAADGGCTITPIIYDAEATPGIVGMLDPKDSTVVMAFRRGASAGNYLSGPLVWDVLGASQIGLHIIGITGTSNAVQVWGVVL